MQEVSTVTSQRMEGIAPAVSLSGQAAGNPVRRILLSRGRFALVDEADFEKLSKYRWHCMRAGNNLYACRCEGRRVIMMHREILEVPAELYVDHINHDGLDNRRCNLRSCTPAQNSYNRRPTGMGTSRCKGVSWKSELRRWCAAIGFAGRMIHIGYFDYEMDAAIAYDDKAIELFGEFAALNCQYRPEVARWLQETRLFV